MRALLRCKVALCLQKLRHQDRAAGGAPNRVVTEGHELVVEHVVVPEPTEGDGHSVPRVVLLIRRRNGLASSNVQIGNVGLGRYENLYRPDHKVFFSFGGGVDCGISCDIVERWGLGGFATSKRSRIVSPHTFPLPSVV